MSDIKLYAGFKFALSNYISDGPRTRCITFKWLPSLSINGLIFPCCSNHSAYTFDDVKYGVYYVTLETEAGNAYIPAALGPQAFALSKDKPEVALQSLLPDDTTKASS